MGVRTGEVTSRTNMDVLKRVHVAIGDAPGSCLRDVARTCIITEDMAKHYVRKLAHQGLVRKQRVGRIVALFPNTAEWQEEEQRILAARLESMRHIISTLEGACEGMTVRELEEATGFGNYKVRYALDLARKHGFVTTSRRRQVTTYAALGTTH